MDQVFLVDFKSEIGIISHSVRNRLPGIRTKVSLDLASASPYGQSIEYADELSRLGSPQLPSRVGIIAV